MKMRTRIVKIGIIGCGWIVENAHIPAMLKILSIDIKSVFDIEIKRATRLANLFNIDNAYDDINDFFNSGIDAVIIATPNFTHVEYSLQALKYGMHVLCEKPVGIYSQNVKEIIDLAQEKKLLYIPAFVNRWRQDIVAIRDLILSGRIGNIISVDAGWLRKCGVPRPGTWFTNKELSGGGVLIDLGSHIADIGLMLLGDRKPLSYSLSTLPYKNVIESSSAANWFKANNYDNGLHANVEKTAYASIKFEGGGLLNLKLSWESPIDGDCTYFNIIGTNGTIKLKTLFGFSNDRLWNDDSLIIEDDKSNITIMRLDRDFNNTKNAFSDMAKYFVDLINGVDATYTNCSDALRTVELIENLYKVERIDYDAIRSIGLEEFQYNV